MTSIRYLFIENVIGIQGCFIKKSIDIFQVSLTEEVCEACSEHGGGVCIKSSDQQCFKDPSFETKWVKLCNPHGKDYVKREERSGLDSTLVTLIYK